MKYKLLCEYLAFQKSDSPQQCTEMTDWLVDKVEQFVAAHPQAAQNYDAVKHFIWYVHKKWKPKKNSLNISVELFE